MERNCTKIPFEEFQVWKNQKDERWDAGLFFNNVHNYLVIGLLTSNGLGKISGPGLKAEKVKTRRKMRILGNQILAPSHALNSRH